MHDDDICTANTTIGHDTLDTRRAKSVSLCYELLRNGLHDRDIVRLISERLVRSKQIVRKDIRLAQRLLCRQYGKDDDTLRCNALALYDSWILDKECPFAVRKAALDSKCELLGLNKQVARVELKAEIKTETTIKHVREVVQENPAARDAMIELARAMAVAEVTHPQ
jgi:hypothetical protein